MSPSTKPEENAEFVRSLARGLQVISAFSQEHPSMTLSEIAERVGLTRATTRRFLHTLVTLGYVRTDTKLFSLTPKVLELGYSYLSSQGLSEILSPHLVQLSANLKESVSAAILDDADILYIARSPGRKLMQLQITVGTRFPAYLTSMGRVLLSGMPLTEASQILSSQPLKPVTVRTITNVPKLLTILTQVQQQGYSLVDGELELGLRSVAVPVRDTQGNVLAAINASTNSGVPERDTLNRILPALLKSASAIEADLRKQRHTGS